VSARLEADHVVVTDAPEANRLHNKGHYGKPLSGGALRLSLVEAAHLVETERLAVEDGAGLVDLPRLVLLGAEREPGFEIEYLVYRELRTRGYLLEAATADERRLGFHFRAYARGDDPKRSEAALLVSAWSERRPARIAELRRLTETAAKRGAANLVALVDEESDLTFYALDAPEPRGSRTADPAAACDGLFLKDRVLVWEPGAASRLHAEAFYGKPVAGGLQLSLIESLHLAKRAGLNVLEAATGKPMGFKRLLKAAGQVDSETALRLRVYDDLRSHGLTVKTGFKFGTHFRAYDDEPGKHHAPYLVHAVAKDHETGWPQVARAVRLSHSVRKSMLFALDSGRRVHYLRLRRFRP
jgi:tRNA-intron endonuclease